MHQWVLLRAVCGREEKFPESAQRSPENRRFRPTANQNGRFASSETNRIGRLPAA
jgi:hypothetical protein